MCRSVRQRTALASCVHLSGRQTDTTGSGPYAHIRPWQCHPASGTPTPHTVASTGSTSVSCRCHLGRPHRFSILLQLSMFLQSRPPHHSSTHIPTHCILLQVCCHEASFCSQQHLAPSLKTATFGSILTTAPSCTISVILVSPSVHTLVRKQMRVQQKGNRGGKKESAEHAFSPPT